MRHFIVCMLLMSFYSYGFGDPGEVDEDGGHYNQKTGEYHYHIKQKEPSGIEEPSSIVSIQSKAVADAQRDALQVDHDIWIAAGIFGGIFGIGAAMIIKPIVPPIALIGKSPEYVTFYTHAYQASVKDEQVRAATAGCVGGTAISVMCLFVLQQQGY